MKDIKNDGIIYMISYSNFNEGFDSVVRFNKYVNTIHIIHFSTSKDIGDKRLGGEVLDSLSKIVKGEKFHVFTSSDKLNEKISQLYPNVNHKLIFGQCFCLRNYDSSDITSTVMDNIIKSFNNENFTYQITGYELNSSILLETYNNILDLENVKYLKRMSFIYTDKDLKRELYEDEKRILQYKKQRYDFLGEDLYNINEIKYSDDYDYLKLVDYCKGILEKRNIRSFDIAHQLFIIMTLFDSIYSEDKEEYEFFIGLFKSLFNENDYRYVVDLIEKYDKLKLEFMFDGSDDVTVFE